MPDTGRQRILVVEDEANIASFVAMYLQKAGFEVAVARNGAEALAKAGTEAPALVVLDLMLPDLDGIDVCLVLREQSRVPIIMLTARRQESDKIVGLDSGADDYVTKPFSFEELLARVRARLRTGVASAPVGVLQAAGVTLDLKTRRAHVDGADVDLSAREFALAEVLFRHPDQVLSREQLLDQVWGYDYDPGSNVVEVYVGYLRKKLGRERIASVRGMGYRLVADDAARP